MKRRIILISLGIVALALILGIAFPVMNIDTISGVITKAAQETKQVGLAAKLYADDHQGRLPQSLDELAPAYLPDKTFFPHVHLATPRAVLADLPPESIILFRVATDASRRETRVIAVRPDISIEWKRP
jgi:hypothetical protein